MKPTRKMLRRKTFVEEDGSHRGPGCKSADFVIDMWAYMKYPRRGMGKKQKPTKEKKGAFRAKETNRKASSSIKKAKEKAIPRRKLKEQTNRQIEDVNGTFADVHNELVIRKAETTGADAIIAATDQRASRESAQAATERFPKGEVTQEEVLETAENIASL